MQLIESFENQLTNMKAELSDKERMLSMYENSMADLSSKMHLLKKSLEEKVRHLFWQHSLRLVGCSGQYHWLLEALTIRPSFSY